MSHCGAGGLWREADTAHQVLGGSGWARNYFSLAYFDPGFAEGGDIRVSIFPQRKEIFISFAALCCVTHDPVGACQSKVREHMARSNFAIVTIEFDRLWILGAKGPVYGGAKAPPLPNTR